MQNSARHRRQHATKPWNRALNPSAQAPALRPVQPSHGPEPPHLGGRSFELAATVPSCPDGSCMLPYPRQILRRWRGHRLRPHRLHGCAPSPIRPPARHRARRCRTGVDTQSKAPRFRASGQERFAYVPIMFHGWERSSDGTASLPAKPFPDRTALQHPSFKRALRWIAFAYET